MEGNLPGERMSLRRRIYGVIWGSPAGTMEYIARRPDFLGAGGLILGLNLVLTVIQLPKIKEFTAWTLQNLKYSPAQVDIAVSATVVTSLAGSVVVPPLMWLVAAALLKLFNAFSGERAEFKSLFAITVFANLPVVLDSIVKTVLVLATPAQNMLRITVSPALFLPPPDLFPGKMYTLLSHFDPFIVWSLVLTALGGSLAMKVPFRRTLAYVMALWLVYVAGVTFLSGVGRA
jgi:hypothetical protein